LASLSNLDIDTRVTSSSSLSNNESERKVKVKLNRLCFLADFVKEGFYSMALDHDMNDNGDTTGNNFDSEVSPSADELAGELEMMNDASLSQDKLLRCTVKEWNELKVKLEQAL
jgi:hypothetical protein